MPIEMLKQINEARIFPQAYTAEAEMDKIRILRAAGLLVAELPLPGYPGAATVLCISPEGQQALHVDAQRAQRKSPALQPLTRHQDPNTAALHAPI